MSFADRARRLTVLWLVLSTLAGGAFFLARYQSPERLAVGDTYWYMKQAQIFAGVSEERASVVAGEQSCRDGNRSLIDHNRKPTCESYGVISAPQYVAIFASRPGYPLFAAPFVKVFGAWRGMVLATLLLAMLAAALSYLAIAMASRSPLAGFLGTVLFLTLPSGWWMSRLLAEAGVLAGYLALLISVMLVWRGRRAGGLLLMAASLVWLFAFRSASGMAGALAVIGASLLVALFAAGQRRAALLTAGVGVAAMAVWQVIAIVFTLPGLDTTIQDYASRHWRGPEVADPIGWLVDKNLEYWPEQGMIVLTDPWFVVLFVLAAVVLVKRDRVTALPWLLIGLTGVAMQIAHPVTQEWDRMNMALWIPVSLAFGWALALALRSAGPLEPQPAAAAPTTTAAEAAAPETTEPETTEPEATAPTTMGPSRPEQRSPAPSSP